MLRNVKGYETRSNNGMMTSTGVYCVLLQMADDEHSACITADGSSYTWGDGCDGKLGHDDETDRSSPTLVNGLVGKRPRRLPAENLTLLFEQRMEGYTVLGLGQATNLDMVTKKIGSLQHSSRNHWEGSFLFRWHVDLTIVWP